MGNSRKKISRPCNLCIPPLLINKLGKRKKKEEATSIQGKTCYEYNTNFGAHLESRDLFSRFTSETSNGQPCPLLNLLKTHFCYICELLNGWYTELVFPTAVYFNSTDFDLAIVIPNSTVIRNLFHTTTS